MKTLFDYKVEWFHSFQIGEDTLTLFARTSGELMLEGGVREETGHKLKVLMDSGLRDILKNNGISFIEHEHSILLDSTTWVSKAFIGQALPSQIEETLLSFKDLIVSVNDLRFNSDEESENSKRSED